MTTSRATLAFACGSKSITSTFFSRSTKAPARLITVVVFPTPPLLLATLTEAPLPAAPVAWLDLHPLQRRPGKVTTAPSRLRQRYAGMGLLHLSQRQFRPRQADRRGGQAGENLSWRDLCGRTPTGL